jgi:hypothetical protein
MPTWTAAVPDRFPGVSGGRRCCGPDPQRHLESIGKFLDAGYDHVYVHQVGPDQEGFFDFCRSEVLPKLG